MRQRARTGLLIALAIVAGSAVLGLLGGLVWSEVAPRALLLEVSAGTAQVVNAETRAFMGADAWFCLITAAAGLLTGIVGCWLGIARRSPETRLAVTIGLIVGAVAGAYAMLWLGQQFGQAGYQHDLADSPVGTTFSGTLTLGAKSAIALWPLFTSIVLVLAELGGRREAGPGASGAGLGPTAPVSSMWTGPQDGNDAP
jgi:hypothetical protein